MRTLLTVSLTVVLAAPAFGQEQQAGNEASTNAEATFQQLIEQCDDTDALVVRARIRLLLGRTAEEAAAEAEGLMDQGLAKCGEGDMEAAMTDLNRALEVADAGTNEVFADAAAEDDGEAEAQEASADAGDASGGGEGEDRPWWKFW